MANLRVVCAAHNTQAARTAFGDRCLNRYAARSRLGPVVKLQSGP